MTLYRLTRHVLFFITSVIIFFTLPFSLLQSLPNTSRVYADSFSVDVITDRLQSPWSVAFLPDDQFLITEKTGQLRLINAQGQISKPIQGLPSIAVVGQGGLLDVALHPDFINNRWVYLSFVSGSAVKGYGVEVVRGKFDATALTLTDVETLFTALPKTKGGRHFGSRLLFTTNPKTTTPMDQYHLYISLGDRGLRDPSQDITNHIGSLIRINDDGTVPSNNPFVNMPNAQPEIFSYGHRNIQGLALHPITGDVWLHEHGPQGGDELNRIAAGKNYGWPVITYGVNYGLGTRIGEGTHKAGMEQPQHIWTPSIAPSGLAFFNGAWFIGALKYQLLAQLTPAVDSFTEQRFLQKRYGRIRDVRVNNGFLYILTDGNKGSLLRLTMSH